MPVYIYSLYIQYHLYEEWNVKQNREKNDFILKAWAVIPMTISYSCDKGLRKALLTAEKCSMIEQR